jgi:UDP-glucose 4-epimerase
MRVALVTGSAGFIGSHVTAALGAAGWTVACLPAGADDFFRRDGEVGGGVPDLVVHCAAVVGGRKVIDWTPIEHAANLETDAALFRWAVRARPGRVIYFSSSCAYPVELGQYGRVLAEHDIDLDWPRRPDGLYGWAKLTGELLAVTAAGAGVPVTVVRPFSVYGPRMNPGFAVTGFAAQAARKADPLVIWGSADQVRDYIHVADVAAAVVTIAEEGIAGPVNLGTGTGTSLRRLAQMITRLAGYQPEIKADPGLPAGVPSLVAARGRLHEFRPPRILLDYGLADFWAGS